MWRFLWRTDGPAHAGGIGYSSSCFSSLKRCLIAIKVHDLQIGQWVNSTKFFVLWGWCWMLLGGFECCKKFLHWWQLHREGGRMWRRDWMKATWWWRWPHVSLFWSLFFWWPLSALFQFFGPQKVPTSLVSFTNLVEAHLSASPTD